MVTSSLRARNAAIALIWLASLIAGRAHAEPLAFGGFDRSMDIAIWIERYPKSTREFTPGADAQEPQENPGQWTAEFLRTHRSGRYALRLSDEEVPDHVYYVQADLRDGTTDRLWLLLEKPLITADRRHPTRSNEARYPACRDVLNPLTAKYGKPEALHPRREEALQSFDYVWTQAPETMKLECGRYDGRKTVFAIGVTFE